LNIEQKGIYFHFNLPNSSPVQTITGKVPLLIFEINLKPFRTPKKCIITIIPDEVHPFWDCFILKYASSKEQNISDSKIVKILSTAPAEKGFYFYSDLDRNTGETANSLETFAKKLETINADSIKFHFQRKDFQNWIQTTVGDDVLAERINHLSGQLPVEDLRNELVKTVKNRISQLRLLHGEMIPSQ